MIARDDQRRKGRDLLDLWHGLTSAGASAERLVACFGRYMREEGHQVTRAAFEENLARIDGVPWRPPEPSRL